MSIDRIGKGSGAPPAVPQEGAGAVDRAQRTEKTFEVRTESTAAPGQAQAVGQVAPSALERLRAGEIDVDGYVDLKVEQATAHLQGVPPQELEGIRATLREQLASDPALVDLVHQATGRTPTSSHE